MKCRAIAVAAALSVATGAAMASPWNHHPQFSFSLIGGEANTLSNVAIFGAVGLYGCVGIENTAYATVQNDQTALVWGTRLNAPPPTNYVATDVTITNNYSRNSVNDTGSAHLNASVSTSHFDNTATWKTMHESGSSNSNSSFLAGGGYIAGHADQGSGGFIAGGGHDSVSLHGPAGGIGGGILPLPGGGAIYGTALHGHASVSAGTVWGGYEYGNESSSAGGFLAGGFVSKHHDFDKSFHKYTDEGSASRTHDSIHANADWGFSNTLTQSDFSVNAVTQIHTTTAKMPEMNAGIGAGALSSASGNVGVNIAVGVDNVQANNVAIAAMNAGPVYGAAQVFSNQKSSGYGTINGYAVNATVGDGALANASGNVGVNIASGMGNVQANNLAAAVTTVKAGGGGSVVATAQNNQIALMNAGDCDNSFVPTAALGAGALSNASGNIGVNLAAGLGNVQNNTLAISSVSLMK